MAAGPLTQVSDIVVPEIFTPYIQQLTEQKSRLIQSGALQNNALMNQLLGGGGLTFNVPSFKDLDDDDENVSSDEVADIYALAASGGSPALPGSFNDSIPHKVGTATEIAVRMNRNSSWSSADLASVLAGADPMQAIGNRVSMYWTRRLQAAFVATMTGVFADNTANDGADYTNDVSGGSFIDGVTNFSAEAFIDAQVTMGDSAEDLSIMMVHSVVYARMKKNNLIDFIPDARGETQIATFLGHEVIVDDSMVNASNVYDTWIFGAGAVQFGRGNPKVPTEVERQAAAGNGGGQEILHSRVEWSLHPVGHAYTGTAANGGPSNAATSNNLAAAGSWNRVYTERKQIKVARLITREA